jgi:hypothetical protein
VKKNLQNGEYWLIELPFVFIALSIILSLRAFAQKDTARVPSDVPPGEGNLNNAMTARINARTLSNTVFKLEPFGCYVLTGTTTGKGGGDIIEGNLQPRNYEETFDGKGAASRVYLYRLSAKPSGASNFVQIKKPILLK